MTARKVAPRWKWQADLLASKLKPRTKVVGIALANYVNNKRGDLKAWPSHKTLAAKCGIGERSVRRALAELLGKGFLEIVEGTGGGGLRADGTGRTPRYKLRFPDAKPGTRVPGIEGQNPDRIDQIPGQSGSIPGQSGSNTRHPGADKLTTNLLENSLKNLKANTDEESSKEAFKRLVESVPDNHEWPEGNVPKARDKQHAKQVVARAAVVLLGYNPIATKDGIQFGHIDGVNADEFIMRRFPPHELVGALTMCTHGELIRQELGQALTALGIPKAAHHLGQSIDNQGATQ